MKLSTRCTYATQALFDIALNGGEEAVQIRQIAERQRLPSRFLEQIFHDLKRAELVEGRRGRNGGYALLRAPAEITLADIIEATDGPLTVEPCGHEGAGPHDLRCIPSIVWQDVAQQINTIFTQFTLADLITRAQEAGLHLEGDAYMYFI